MKSCFVQRSAVLSLLVAASFAPASVLAQHKCDNPTMEIDKRAIAKAAEGPDALRNFVTRTRMNWHLDMQDQYTAGAKCDHIGCRETVTA